MTCGACVGGGGVAAAVIAQNNNDNSLARAALLAGNINNDILDPAVARIGCCNNDAALLVAARDALQPCCPLNAAERANLEVIEGRRLALLGPRLCGPLPAGNLNSQQSLLVDAQIEANREAIIGARLDRAQVFPVRRPVERPPLQAPCLPLVDANILELQEDLFTPGCARRCERVCRVPSRFRALTNVGAVQQAFNGGCISELPTPQFVSAKNRGTAGLGGTQGLRFGNMCVQAQNILQQPKRFCRTPSVFRCLGNQCNSGFCFQLGITDELPTFEAVRGRAFGGGLGGGVEQRIGGNICVPAVRYGNPV